MMIFSDFFAVYWFLYTYPVVIDVVSCLIVNKQKDKILLGEHYVKKYGLCEASITDSSHICDDTKCCRDKHKTIYGFISGKVEKEDEDILGTAKREIREELGEDSSIIKHISRDIYNHHVGTHFVKKVLYSLRIYVLLIKVDIEYNIDEIYTNGDDCCEMKSAKWVPLKTLREGKFE